jgi:hypothetical protein
MDVGGPMYTVRCPAADTVDHDSKPRKAGLEGGGQLPLQEGKAGTLVSASHSRSSCTSRARRASSALRRAADSYNVIPPPPASQPATNRAERGSQCSRHATCTTQPTHHKKGEALCRRCIRSHRAHVLRVCSNSARTPIATTAAGAQMTVRHLAVCRSVWKLPVPPAPPAIGAERARHRSRPRA